jgi:outer membrane biosynthesis protein TonB
MVIVAAPTCPGAHLRNSRRRSPPLPRRLRSRHRALAGARWPTSGQSRFPGQPDQTPSGPSAVAETPAVVEPEPEVAPAPESAPDPPAAVSDRPAPPPEAPAPSEATEPVEIKPRVPAGTPARSRVRSRTGGRVWQGRAPSRKRLGLGTAGRRRSTTPRPASHRAKPGSRNLRRLYPPLIGLLLIVVVVGLLSRGAGGSSTTSTHTASAPASVFPTPSPIPAPTPPPVPVPAPATQATQAAKPPPVAPQPKPCRPVQVNGRTIAVSILHGHVICRNARAVVRALESGKGRRGGSPAHPSVTVRGWRCVPSGVCTRPGKAIKAA